MNEHKVPKPQVMWAFYNYGCLHGVAHTRRAAIKAVEAHVMAPWGKACEYMQIRKVTVTPVSGDQR